VEKRPERNRQRPVSYLREVATDDFLPLKLRSRKQPPIKSSPLKSQSRKTTHTTTPITRAGRPRGRPPIPRSSSSLSISASTSLSKGRRLIPVVDLTDIPSPKRSLEPRRRMASASNANARRRAQILRSAHARHIVSGKMTESRLARALSKEVRRATAYGENST